LSQMAVEQYRRGNPQWEGTFMAVRLPYHTQADASDVSAAMEFIAPDEDINFPIGSATDALAEAFNSAIGQQTTDYTLGIVKVRMIMVAQYALAARSNALVIVSDQAAEAITCIFLKFEDGLADVMPLSGLNKTEVRDMGARLGT